MKRSLIALAIVAAVSFQAQAQDVTAAMVAECQRQMTLGVCSAANDTTVRPKGTKVIIGKRRVAVEAYDYVRKGDATMCPLVARACLADPDGDVCYTGKALWGGL